MKLNYNNRQGLLAVKMYEHGLPIDILRVLFTVLISISIFKVSEIASTKASITGVIITLYSIGLLAWRWKKQKTNQRTEFMTIIIDILWIVLLSFLLNNHVMMVALLLLQLFGISLRFGFPVLRFTLITQITLYIITHLLFFNRITPNYLGFEFINSGYYIVVFILMMLAWQKERKLNSQIYDHLSNKISKIKNCIEVRKILNLGDDWQLIQQQVRKLTLEKSLIEEIADCEQKWGKSSRFKLAETIAALLGRMFCAKECIIALFNKERKELKIKGVFGSLEVPENLNLDLQENIINQVALQGEIVNLKQNSLVVTKTVLGQKVQNFLCVPISSKSGILGVIYMINKYNELTGEFLDFDAEDEQLLSFLADYVGISLENQELYEELETSFLSTIRAMVNALDARDPYTKGHSEQVAKYALLIGKELNLSEVELKNLRYAALLHDIGKLGVAESILHKPSGLTPDEYSQMKLHPYFGRQILQSVGLFQKLLPAIYHHHERWDGQGYPDGLKEEEIPLEARILAVADAFEAMISHRVYRKCLGKEMAVNELIKYTGKQFDPKIVDVFLTAIDRTELSKDELFHWKLDTIRNVYRDVIMAVTQCRLVLAERWELVKIFKQGEVKLEINIRQKDDVPTARKKIEKLLGELRVEQKIIRNLLLCVSEAISNMLKHAQGGIIQVIVNDLNIWIVAIDKGPGIKLRDIPKATLKKGFSTKKSLGMGFSILLELLDRVYIETNEEGTTVVLEQNRLTEKLASGISTKPGAKSMLVDSLLTSE